MPPMLRRWNLTIDSPLIFSFGPDVRDHSAVPAYSPVWSLDRQQIFTLKTTYYSHVREVRLMIAWQVNGQSIHIQPEAMRLTTLASSYQAWETFLTPELKIECEYLALPSGELCARFTVINSSETTQDVSMSVEGEVEPRRQTRVIPLHPRDLHISGQAMVFILDEVLPVTILKGAPAVHTSTSHVPTATSMAIPAGEKGVFKMTHAVSADVTQSIALAVKAQMINWQAEYQRLELQQDKMMQLETGDELLDAVLVSSQIHSLNAVKNAETGEVRPDRMVYSSHFYGLVLNLITTDAPLAQRLIRHLLQSQKPNGVIPNRIGAGRGIPSDLAMPLLSRLSWSVFQYTEDSQFLRDVFPALSQFYTAWRSPEHDRDGDGIPEWGHSRVNAYVLNPLFHPAVDAGQGLDLNRVESPDLVAYLLSEAMSLREIAFYLRDEPQEPYYTAEVETLTQHLTTLWDVESSQFVYRDRDTHETPQGVNLIEGARGGETISVTHEFLSPQRLIVRVTGGLDNTPHLILRIQGLNQHGEAYEEVAHAESFTWLTGTGVYTTQGVFSYVDQVSTQHLVTGYSVSVSTADLVSSDITQWVPLWTGKLNPDQTQSLITHLQDPQLFWREAGLASLRADQSTYNSKNTGAVLPFFNLLMAEALIEIGRFDEAHALITKMLNTSRALLTHDHAFFELIDADEVRGVGSNEHGVNAFPVHILLRLWKVRIISQHKVWTGGEFKRDQSVTVRQYGVTVRRSMQETTITFPSGNSVTLDAQADFQEVIDING